MARGKRTQTGTGQTITAIILLALALILASAGCFTQGGDNDVTIVSAEVVATPGNAGPRQTTDLPPVATTAIPIVQKNISITRPENPKTSYTCTLTHETCMALQALDKPAEAEKINGFLRWESARARTNSSETERLNILIEEIDSALSATYAGEDLVLYAAAGTGIPDQIRSSGTYYEEGYISGSYDISVIWHESRTAVRDNTGYTAILVFEETRGSHILYLNETRRTIIIPHGMKWELAGEEQIDHLVITPDSMPKFRDERMEKVRLMYLTRIT